MVKNRGHKAKAKSNSNPVRKLSIQVRLGEHANNINAVASTVGELEGFCSPELLMELKGLVSQIKYDQQQSNFDRERMMQYTNAFNSVLSRCNISNNYDM